MKFIMQVAIGLVFMFNVAQAETVSQRIVSAGGDLTEIIYALDAEDRLVGVDSTSNYPAIAKDKKQIGYVRRISSEGILSIKPDLVIGAYDMGPAAAIEQLRAAGVRVELAPRGDSIGGVPAKIRFVGMILGLKDKAEKLASSTESELARIAAKVKKMTANPKVIFVMNFGSGAPLVGGEGTSAETIIQLAGATNAAKGFDGFKPMSREAIQNSQPEVLLMMESTINRLGGIDKIMERPEIALTPAGKNNRYVSMEGMLLLGFGPRTPQAIASLSEAVRK